MSLKERIRVSSSYIEAVISLLGIDNDQLAQNVASMLRDEIRKASQLGHACIYIRITN